MNELQNLLEKIFGEQICFKSYAQYLELDSALDEALATVTPREEKVIKMRFGLGNTSSEHTLEEVGLYLGVTRQRVHQIEYKALRKLRHPSRSQRLKVFLESGQ